MDSQCWERVLDSWRPDHLCHHRRPSSMLSMASSTPVCWMTNLTFHPTRKIDITLILYIWKITISKKQMETVSYGREDDGEDVGWRTQVNIRKGAGSADGQMGMRLRKTVRLQGQNRSAGRGIRWAWRGRKMRKRITDRTWPRAGREPAAQIHQDWVELAWTQGRQWAILSALLTSLIELWRIQRDPNKRGPEAQPDIQNWNHAPHHNSPGRLQVSG